MTTTHPADDHAFLRVEGARENNLKNVTVELPKRRLTVFTGISGSGKSSLVFATIAAESQRMINETYSAFVQGFMPSLARPDVDHLEGLTTAIIVDQERMGANPRSTVGTATDANAMLRILFSRLGDPYVGPPTAYSFNVPTRKASGMMTTEKGGRTERRIAKQEVYLGGMCPRCEGMGKVNDIDLTALYDEEKSLNDGALTVPGYSMDGWYGRLFEGMGLPMDKPIRDYSATELDDLLHKEPTRLKVEGTNLTYVGLIPQIQKSYLSKDVEAMQPHIRTFVERAITFTVCPDCHGTRLSRTGGQHGTDAMVAGRGKRLGKSSGVVFQRPGYKTVYVAGDTLWNRHVEDALQAYRPDVIVLNACYGRLLGYDGAFIMGKEDLYRAYQAAPRARIVASHMEAIAHCTHDRKDLRAYIAERHMDPGRVLVPEDGEAYRF